VADRKILGLVFMSVYDCDLTVKLEQFEGPLDLLLHLIKEAKIDIKEIFVSEVTEQFLIYIKQFNFIDIDKASEFMEMAATLLEIKSRSLLPKIEDLMPLEDDPKEKLIRQLEEYKLFQHASGRLKGIENVNRFYKLPSDCVFDTKIVLKDLTLEALLNAYANILYKIERGGIEIKTRKIDKEQFTVADKISLIREVLTKRKRVSFFELFENDCSRGEVISTFLALLELLRVQFVFAEQNGIYDDITLFYNDTVKVAV
jgi:segregation and condensation protein A